MFEIYVSRQLTKKVHVSQHRSLELLGRFKREHWSIFFVQNWYIYFKSISLSTRSVLQVLAIIIAYFLIFDSYVYIVRIDDAAKYYVSLKVQFRKKRYRIFQVFQKYPKYGI